MPEWGGIPSSDGVGKVIACATLSTRQCRPSFKQARTRDIIALPPYRSESRVELHGRYYRQVHADQGFSAQTPGGPLRVLLVIKCLGFGGAERLLVDMVAAGDRRRFDYEVAYVLRDLDALVPSLLGGGTAVHALGAAHNTDLRWMAVLRRLLSGRALRRGPLPSPVRGRSRPAGRGFPPPLRTTPCRVHRAQPVGPGAVW